MWQDYVAKRDFHTVTGNLRIQHNVYSPELRNHRDILVYLPPSYHTTSRRYPVIYMHDGQNLFDALTSFSGEWGVDETMEALSQEGREAIVVGIPNTPRRQNEYNPYDNRRFGHGRGDLYLQFVMDSVKSRVDADFRTLPDRDHTGIMGSSMGALISLYAYLKYRQVFGFVGAMSPAFWIASHEIMQVVEHAPVLSGRIYIDVGTNEMSRRTGQIPIVPRVAMRLQERGFHVKYVVEKDGNHNEADWRRRLPDALRFLLG